VRNRVAVLTGLAWAFFALACSTDKESKTLTLETFPVVHPTVLDTVYTKEYVAQIQSIQNCTKPMPSLRVPWRKRKWPQWS
jgi:hypothetical protein